LIQTFKLNQPDEGVLIPLHPLPGVSKVTGLTMNGSFVYSPNYCPLILQKGSCHGNPGKLIPNSVLRL